MWGCSDDGGFRRFFLSKYIHIAEMFFIIESLCMKLTTRISAGTLKDNEVDRFSTPY